MTPGRPHRAFGKASGAQPRWFHAICVMPAAVPDETVPGMTAPDAAAEPRLPLPRGLIVVLAVTGLLVSVLALRQFTAIIGPILLALILVIGVHPLTGFLRRHGAPM